MLSLIAFAAAVAAPADPPPPPTTESAPIVIQGVKQRDKAIHDFVTALTPSKIDGQLSRFEDKVCPAAAGLPDAQNALVQQRLRDIAAAADVPLETAGCAPNNLVIVVQDKDAFVAELRKRYPVYFSDLVKGLIETPHEPGPAVAWHVDGLLTADGTPATRAQAYASGISLGDGMQSGDRFMGGPFVARSVDATRIRPATIRRFMAAVVVVEAGALAGLSTTQLADYAALRLYARTDPHKLKPGSYTILGVLDAPMGSPVPVTMTEWDLAFLKGLYNSDNRQYANRQRNEIEQSVRKQVDRTANP